MEALTRLVERETGIKHRVLPFLYTPNESMSTINIADKRICNLFWTDIISDYSIDRTITFSWWQEDDKPAPAAEQPDLFTQGK